MRNSRTKIPSHFKTLNGIFLLSLFSSAGLVAINPAFATSIGGCGPTYTPTTGDIIVCSPTITPAAAAGVISAMNNTTVNNISVTVNSGTTLDINGSTIGLGPGSTVVNNGTLNTQRFFYGYGISMGANGRGQTGGNSVTNNGSIITGGTSADGIRIQSKNTASLDSIVNTGSIQATGNNSNGISLQGAGTVSNSGTITSKANAIDLSSDTASTSSARRISVSNTGTLTSTSEYGIYSAAVKGVDITNSGTITGALDAINLAAGNNTLTIQSGSTISGAIVANAGSATERLTFSGYTNTSFNNALSNWNIIESSNSSNVILNNTSGYALAGANPNLSINVDSTSSLGISTTISGIGSLTKVGVGTLTLSGANTYSGGTTLNAGTIAVANNSALGTNNLSMASGTTLQAASAVSLNNNISITGTGNFDTNGNAMTLTGVISGAGELNKLGAGTLTLSGANTYSGATNINAGTLTSGAADVIPNNSAVTVALGANWNLNNFSETVGSIAGAGNIALGSAALTAGGNNTSTTFSGVISGTGSLTKEGTGTLTLSGANNYSGATNINAGTVILTGSITSNTTIANAATLQGGGTITGTLSNAGNITPSYTNIPTNLTVIGNYVGQGGTFNTNVYAPPSGTPTADQLIISGNGHTTSGTTSLNVIDKGGLGSPTSGNGIQVIATTNNATTASGTFSLGGRVASGAFEYRLFKGGETANTTTDNNWYLRTDNPLPPTAAPVTPDPRERIEVAVYPALPSLARLYAFSSIDTLEQRRSDLTTMGTDQKSTGQNGWARITGRQGTNAPSNVNEGPKLNFNSYSIQIGADVYQNENKTSRTYVGPFFTFGGSGGDTFNSANTQRTGKLSMLAYSVGMNAIYFNNNGLYVDAIGQITRFENMRAASTENADIFTKGWGFTGSLESGFKLPLNQQWALTPQAQIVVDSINLDKTSDAYGEIEFNKDQVSRGRVGLMLSHQQKSGDENIKGWLRTSVWDVFKGGTNTGFSSLYGNNPVFFQSTTGSRWLALDAGLTAQLSKTSSAFVNLGWDTSFNSDYKAVYGKVGIQKRW